MKTLRFATLLMITALLLSACGGNAAPANPPLRIAMTLWPGVYPAAIAQQQGFFAKHNVQVELVPYENYPQSYVDLASGKLDGVAAVIGDALLISDSTKLKFVFASDYSDGADQFVAGPEIQSAADLRGKRIGVNFGTYGEFFVRTWLEQNGVSPNDVTFVNVPAENAGTAYPGQVDAIHAYDPYSTEAINKGAHVLFTSSDTPRLALDVMVFPAKLVAERPEDIQAFTDAWFEAVDWMAANPDQIPAAVSQASGFPEEYVWMGGDTILTRAESQALMQPGDTPASVYYWTQKYIDFLAASGILSKAPAPEDLIVSSFVQ